MRLQTFLIFFCANGAHTLPAADAASNEHGKQKRKTASKSSGFAGSVSGRPLRHSSSTHLAAVAVPTNHTNSGSLCMLTKPGAAPFAGARRQTAKMLVHPTVFLVTHEVAITLRSCSLRETFVYTDVSGLGLL